MTPSDPHLSVVIPAYNEERRIGTTLQRVVGFLSAKMPGSEVVVVDDGSRDGTAALARSFDGTVAVRVLGDGVNRGKGFAVRHGMLHARGAYILMSDADLSTPIEEVTLLLSPVMRGDYDIAIGSRGLPSSRLGQRQPWARERMGRIFNVLVRAVTGLPFLDTQCGFKLFTRDAARNVFSTQRGSGFAFDAEVLYLARRAGFRVVEEPVTWNNSLGSKVDPIVDSLRMLRDLVRVRIWDMRGLYDAPRVHA
ncbi:MAG: dolichyl-phosphate beta-glucosyltransferase [Acidobacteriota bacterium]